MLLPYSTRDARCHICVSNDIDTEFADQMPSGLSVIGASHKMTGSFGVSPSWRMQLLWKSLKLRGKQL